MPEYTVDEGALAGFFKSLSSGRLLLSPQGAGPGLAMAPTEPDKVSLDYANTHLSPKTLFFPQTERLMAFSKDPKSPQPFVYKDLGDKAEPAVLFGIRPCDAKGFSVCDRVFQNDRFTDPYWKGKYEKTARIGLACVSPSPQCFCAAVGGSPFGEAGLDALAWKRPSGGLGLKAVTEAGKKLLAEAGLAEAELSAEIKELEAKAVAAQGALPDYSAIDSKPLMELFGDPQWQSTAETCLNCGVCTFVCPTCHCFDIQDEDSDTGGVRMRNWDTCMSWLFTVHGTGHNPRPSKTERVRQRFMHKLKYIPLKQEGCKGCTGCGRCVVMCPVNIDIRSVAIQMSRPPLAKQA
jgi:ferredoxin